MNLPLLFALVASLALSINAQAAAPYYGLPLGSIFYGSSSTKGDVYASDPKTLTVINFQHGGEEGCTTFMLGPPKPGADVGVSPNKDGVILAFKHRPKRQRRRRQAPDANLVPQIQALNPNRHPLDWPFEFGHLRVEEGGQAGPSIENAPKHIQDPFDVSLSPGDEENENSTRVPVTVTPDPETTYNFVSSAGEISTTHAPPVTRIRTVSPITEETGSSKSSSSATASSGSSASDPGTILSTIPPGSPVLPNGASGAVAGVLSPEVGVTASIEEVTPETEPPSLNADAPEEIGPGDLITESTAGLPDIPGFLPVKNATEPAQGATEAEETVTIPPERKALWSRPPVSAGEEPSTDQRTPTTASTTQGAATRRQQGRHGTTAAASTGERGRPSDTPGKPVSREGATVIKFGESKPAGTDPPTEAPRERGEPVARGRTEAPPTDVTIGKGIVWGDGSGKNSAPANPQGKPASPPAASSGDISGGIFWSDSNAPPPPRPRTQTPQAQQQNLIQLGETGSKRPQSSLRNLPVEYIGGLNIPDEEEGKGNPNITALLNDPFNPQPPAIVVNEGRTREPLPPPGEAITIYFGGKKAPTATTPEPQKTFRGIPLQPAAPAAPAAPASGPPGSQSATTVTEKAFQAPVENGNGTGECGNGWCVVADPHRRRPAPDVTAEAPAAATPEAKQGNGSGWYVIADRHEQLRQPAEIIATKTPFQDAQDTKPQAPVEVTATRYPAPNLPPTEDGKIFILPKTGGNNLIINLPDPYVLSDFQWFGVYDHCKRTRTAYVNVRGVEPPQEVKLDGIRGWQYDVNSGPIHVMNCNTLLITNFTYTGAGKTEAFIYIGNGAFPHSINQKGRANVVGTFPDRSIKNFDSEDVLVRLPTGWKTFDITWIAIFNPKGNVSYGHVLVPPLVVPPCDDQN